MAELRNINWGKLLRDTFNPQSLEILLKSRSLQWALTTALRKQGLMVLDWSEDLIVEYKGLRYKTDLINYPRIFEAYDRYRIDEIQKDGVVVDLGANIGSFSVPATTRAKVVYAWEPLFYDRLWENCALNYETPGRFLLSGSAVAGTYSGDIWVDCQEYGKSVSSVPFRDIKEQVGKIDFLRMDIGGKEWEIHPSELEDIRNLEIEFHFWKGIKGGWSLWKKWLKDEGYSATARWSKHKHWLYLSARKDGTGLVKEFHLPDGSFKGKSLDIWRS